ncbi:MAG: hypothetical protein KBT01_06010 [Clostridiales bacterium]|nr:hypothetical protein [Candidatus Blautia equi]
MSEDECGISCFKKNTNSRILRQILFSTDEKVRDMYGRKDLITGYIREIPLDDTGQDLISRGSEATMKKQYLDYWSRNLMLDEEKQKRMSEIWDAEVLDKYSNPRTGRAAVFFKDGRKLVDDDLVEVLMKTFLLQ